MSKIFVYGTLKKGKHNHSIIKGSKLIGNGVIRGYKLYHTPYGFPAIFKCDDKNEIVVGEIYEVTEEVARDVDMLEGYFSPNNPRNLYEKMYTVDIIRDIPIEVYAMNDRMLNEDFIKCNPIWL